MQWLSDERVQSRLACWTQAHGAKPALGAVLTKRGGDAEALAFVDVQARVLATMSTPAGRVEAMSWSPDGTRLLVRQAEPDADHGGVSGGIQASSTTCGPEAWRPSVTDGSFVGQWRRALIVDTAALAIATGWTDARNVWECCWCGDHALAALVSELPSEDHWYTANVELLDLATGTIGTIFSSTDQVAGLCGSPSGRRLALIEGTASDRELLAGRLIVIDTATGAASCIETHGVDVTRLRWTAEDTLMWCGLRGLESVLGQCDTQSGAVTELWVGKDKGLGLSWLPDLAPVGHDRACAVVSSFTERPVLALIAQQRASSVLALGSGPTQEAVAALSVSVKAAEWTSSADGEAVQGWLLTPAQSAPAPLAMEIHGGPAWAAQPRWLGNNVLRRQLLEHRFAVFLPNPRGSVGRGRVFARSVYGDPGGNDAVDLESGIDRLVADGIADPYRLYAYGVSYGGYMSSWLVTRSHRFAAVMACSPVTNWISQQFTCQMPAWCGRFVGEPFPTASGLHFWRSPVYAAGKINTPVLLVSGALDRNTPPGQALEMYQALQLLGKHAQLVIYPLEGHGVRGTSAAVDYADRVRSWFSQHSRAVLRDHSPCR